VIEHRRCPGDQSRVPDDHALDTGFQVDDGAGAIGADGERAGQAAVGARARGDHLDGHLRPGGHLGQVLDLLAHDRGVPDLVGQDRLPEQDPHLERGLPVEDGLAVQPGGDALVQVPAVIGSPPQDRAGVIPGLEQARDQQRFPPADHGGATLGLDPVAEPGRMRPGPSQRVVAKPAEPAAHLRERLIAGGREPVAGAEGPGFDPGHRRGVARDPRGQVRQGHARRDTGAADLGAEEVRR
jgi:hypothetical protein